MEGGREGGGMLPEEARMLPEEARMLPDGMEQVRTVVRVRVFMLHSRLLALTRAQYKHIHTDFCTQSAFPHPIQVKTVDSTPLGIPSVLYAITFIVCVLWVCERASERERVGLQRSTIRLIFSHASTPPKRAAALPERADTQE